MTKKICPFPHFEELENFSSVEGGEQFPRSRWAKVPIPIVYPHAS